MKKPKKVSRGLRSLGERDLSRALKRCYRDIAKTAHEVESPLIPKRSDGIVAGLTEQDPAPAPAQLGRCRRHAPTMNGYPVVTPADWCGDHKLATPSQLTPEPGDPWAHRSAGMRCSSCMFYVPKRDS